jgi:hypothetical protein
MMKNLGIIVAAWRVLAVAARAQMEMPKPGPEHKKLDVFAGVWALDGDMKTSPMGSTPIRGPGRTTRKWAT